MIWDFDFVLPAQKSRFVAVQHRVVAAFRPGCIVGSFSGGEGLPVCNMKGDPHGPTQLPDDADVPACQQGPI